MWRPYEKEAFLSNNISNYKADKTKTDSLLFIWAYTAQYTIESTPDKTFFINKNIWLINEKIYFISKTSSWLTRKLLR